MSEELEKKLEELVKEHIEEMDNKFGVSHKIYCSGDSLSIKIPREKGNRIKRFFFPKKAVMKIELMVQMMLGGCYGHAGPISYESHLYYDKNYLKFAEKIATEASEILTKQKGRKLKRFEKNFW